MKPLHLPHSQSFARFVLAALCALGPAGLGASSGCYYDDDDDDGFCDDDDFDDEDYDDDEDCGDDDGSVIIVFGQSSDSYRLTDYRIETSSDPREHPIAGVLVEGISIFGLLGPGAYGAQEFRDVSDRILLANEDLLGLPEQAGRRRFARVDFSSDGIAVSYAQERDTDGAWRDVPAAATVFRYDLAGALTSIENRLSLAASPSAR